MVDFDLIVQVAEPYGPGTTCMPLFESTLAIASRNLLDKNGVAEGTIHAPAMRAFARYDSTGRLRGSRNYLKKLI